MGEFAAEFLLYYFPAIIFLVLFIAVILKLRTISNQLNLSNETNKETAETLSRIQKLLEGRNA